VAYNANGEVGLMAVEAGLHVLLETPIAHKLSEADAIIAAAQARGLKIEVAEQFHRRPLEQIKLKLLETGLFGRVYTAYNDFAGHGYHGVSVLRSYLGFDAKAVRVNGLVKDYELAPHWSLLDKTRGARTETQEHGLIEFDGGQTGIFHWTSVAYDSAMRWWRSSRFQPRKAWASRLGLV
jgi:predicted dehydrogenase